MSVDKHPVGRERGVVALVEFAAEGIVEGRVDFGFDLSPNNMDDEREAGIAQCTNDVIAAKQTRIDLAYVGCFEGIAVELQDGQDEAVAGLENVVIDMTGVGNVGCDGTLSPRHRPKRQFVDETASDHRQPLC